MNTLIGIAILTAIYTVEYFICKFSAYYLLDFSEEEYRKLSFPTKYIWFPAVTTILTIMLIWLLVIIIKICNVTWTLG